MLFILFLSVWKVEEEDLFYLRAWTAIFREVYIYIGSEKWACKRDEHINSRMMLLHKDRVY